MTLEKDTQTMTENDNYAPPLRPAKEADRPVDQSCASNDTTISDIDLQALVDGELTAQQEEAVRRIMLNDSAARTRYRELLEQKRLLIAWWRQFS